VLAGLELDQLPICSISTPRLFEVLNHAKLGSVLAVIVIQHTGVVSLLGRGVRSRSGYRVSLNPGRTTLHSGHKKVVSREEGRISSREEVHLCTRVLHDLQLIMIARTLDGVRIGRRDERTMGAIAVLLCCVESYRTLHIDDDWIFVS